jgi:rubrerythrin
MTRCIRSVEEFYAHALAIEREAAERYREFRDWFGERGEEILAGLCGSIAEVEQEHYLALAAGSQGLALPILEPGEHLWLEAGSPEAPARELFYRVAEPRHLLEIAFQGEKNALAFFMWVERTTEDPRVRAAAREMAQEEEAHVRWVGNALEYHLATSATDWDQLMAAGHGPGAFVGSGAV